MTNAKPVKLNKRRAGIEASVLATGRPSHETAPAIAVLYKNQTREDRATRALKSGSGQ